MLPTNLPQRKQIKRVKRTPGQFRKMQLKLFSTWISTLLGKKTVLFSGFVLFRGGGFGATFFVIVERIGLSTSDPKEKKEQATTNTKAKKGPHTKGRKWKDPHKHTSKKMSKQSVQQIFSDFSFRFWLKCKNANFALRENKRQSKESRDKEGKEGTQEGYVQIVKNCKS